MLRLPWPVVDDMTPPFGLSVLPRERQVIALMPKAWPSLWPSDRGSLPRVMVEGLPRPGLPEIGSHLGAMFSLGVSGGTRVRGRGRSVPACCAGCGLAQPSLPPSPCTAPCPASGERRQAGAKRAPRPRLHAVRCERPHLHHTLHAAAVPDGGGGWPCWPRCCVPPCPQRLRCQLEGPFARPRRPECVWGGGPGLCPGLRARALCPALGHRRAGGPQRNGAHGGAPPRRPAAGPRVLPGCRGSAAHRPPGGAARRPGQEV